MQQIIISVWYFMTRVGILQPFAFCTYTYRRGAHAAVTFPHGAQLELKCQRQAFIEHAACIWPTSRVSGFMQRRNSSWAPEWPDFNYNSFMKGAARFTFKYLQSYIIHLN